MTQYEFQYTEINQGYSLIEAESLEEAEAMATELYYEGGVVWDGVDFSVTQIEED